MGLGNTNRRAEAGRRTREVAERAATPKGAALCGFVGPLKGVCAHTQNMYVLGARVFVCVTPAPSTRELAYRPCSRQTPQVGRTRSTCP